MSVDIHSSDTDLPCFRVTPIMDDPTWPSELQRALRKLESEVREGLGHGFFELSINCEVIKGGKRRLTIKAGKSYQFVIPEQELWVAK